MYTVVQRPNYELGHEIYEQVFQNVIDNNYFLERVEQTTVLLNKLKFLEKQYGCKLPKVIPKRLYDSVGFFWNDFKECKVDSDFFISINLTKLYRTMLSYETMYGLILNKNLILDEATLQWK
jgi:hypothetical protein